MKSINIRGPLSTQIGYAHVSFNVAKALHAQGTKVAYFPIGQPQLTTNDVELLQTWLNNQATFDYKAPSLLVWHEFALGEFAAGSPLAAYPFFEMNRLDARRVHHLKYPDIIFTASQWAKEVLAQYNISSSVVPVGVDRDIFYSKSAEPKDGPTTFINLGKLEIRKGHDILHEAFNRAFSPADNVNLIVSWNNPFVPEGEMREWVQMYKNTPLGNKINFVGYAPTDYALADLIRAADCMVAPTRAEGACLPLLQALSCGLEVITTNYSAHTEFCHRGNAHLVNITKLEPAYDGKWFNGQGEWAHIGEAEIDQMVQHMRDLHRLRQDRGYLYNEVGVDTAKQFTWKHTAQKICDIL